MGNFVEPLAVIAEELLTHLKSIQDESGNIRDIGPELYKWAFQGVIINYCRQNKPVSLTGVSYLVYGEKIEIYSGADPFLKEFMEAGVDYINYLAAITISPPLYRIFPTKTYRDFKRIVRRMQRAGKFKEQTFNV